MSKGNTTELDVLKMILKGVDPSWRANANRYVSLHTADPGEAGDQTTNEATYAGYTRVAVPVADWTVVSNTLANANLLQSGQCSATPNTITHVGIGTLASGAGQLLYSQPISSPLSVTVGVNPQFAVGVLVASED